MTLIEFKNSLTQHQPPPVADLLQALWYEAKGDWEKAHNLAQDAHTPDGSWIHAYLHRVEGDTSNAQYWYHRANRRMPKLSLKEEWDEIVSELLLRN
ncbi:MAG: hypothetical protein KF856_07135 [Cyclobacteriaceae bacterium]|nr:hypothetical protein [Cyclobacteriaceae bacterium]